VRRRPEPGFRKALAAHSGRMVNAGFPDAKQYGFEMVDAPKRKR